VKLAPAAGLLGAFLAGCSSAEPPVRILEDGTEGSRVAGEPGADSPTLSVTTQRTEYPPPPYGTEVGTVVENFRFLGWSDPAAAAYDQEALEPLDLARFYNPDGQGDVELLVMTSTAVWCSVCRGEYEDFRSGKVADYSARGVEFFGVLFEDNDSGPARPSDLATWADTFDVTFPFVLDPAFKLGRFFDRQATPMTMVIDTATMEIAWLEVGWATDGPSSLWAFLDGALATR
jgi:hypothetical protein